MGQYSPKGDSPCGCTDMAGNVWEWCQSQYAHYPYKDDGRNKADGTETRWCVAARGTAARAMCVRLTAIASDQGAVSTTWGSGARVRLSEMLVAGLLFSVGARRLSGQPKMLTQEFPHFSSQLTSFI